MCSMKCESPCSSARSWREPAATKTPIAAVFTCGARLGDDGEARGKARDVWTLTPRPRRLAQIIGHRRRVVGQRDDRSRRSMRSARCGRQRRPHAGRPLDRVGKLRRWAVPSATTGVAGAAASACRAACDADRAVRIDDHAALALDAAPSPRRIPARPPGKHRNRRGCVRARRRGSRTQPSVAKFAHPRRHLPRVAAGGLEQEALEVRRDLDVHRGRLGRLYARGS